jgi:hypothetical protein
MVQYNGVAVQPVKRKRGRPRLIRDPAPVGPDGLPLLTPVKAKSKYVRKKVNVLLVSSNSLAPGEGAPVCTPAKRKYTKRAKSWDLPTSQPGSVIPAPPANGSLTSTRSSVDTDSDSVVTRADILNESVGSTCSADTPDDQRLLLLATAEEGMLNGSCSSSTIANAFQNLKDTVVLDGEHFYRCPVCAYMVKQKGNLRRHLQQHNIFQCSHCPYCTTDNPQLDTHMKDAHPTRWGRRKCTRCSKFYHLEDHDEHLASCTGEKSEWPCDQCPKVFQYEGALKVHLKMHREERPAKLVCGCCGKQYRYEAAMRSHLLAHGAENLVGVCTRCGTKCANDAELQEHVKLHLAAKTDASLRQGRIYG